MNYNEPLLQSAIAIDHEVTIDMNKLESKLDTDGATLVILHTNGFATDVIVSDIFADMPHVDVLTHYSTGENGAKFIQDFWIRLNITAQELYEKLVIKNDPKSDVNSIQNEVKVYVDIVNLGDFHITIQTAHSIIYEGGTAR